MNIWTEYKRAYIILVLTTCKDLGWVT